MVNELVWPFIDKTNERKRRDSRRAAAIFEKRVNNPARNQHYKEDVVRNTQYSEEWRRIEQEVLTEQWVEHALYADIASGFDVVDETWDSAIKNKDYVYAERILEIVKNFSDQFTEDQYLNYVVWDARQRTYTGNIGHSIQDLRK